VNTIVGPWSDWNDERPTWRDPEAIKAWIAREDARKTVWLTTPAGVAYLANEAAKAEAARIREEESRRARRIQTADAIGIPNELGVRTVALDDAPPQTEALARCRDAVAWRKSVSTVGRAGMVRLIAGPPGTGKSCALAWCALRHKPGALYVSAATVVATMRNGWSDNEKRWQEWLAVDLLALDEIGAERGDAASVVYLLGERYNHGLATLVAGNLKRADFQTRYSDERLADRLVNGQGHGGEATGLAWYAAVKGDSLRNPAARARMVGDAAE
jgi:DNA replication protein DnaC